MEPLKLFRVLGHNPRVLRRIQRGGLLDPGAVSLRLRELVILRTCALCSGEYEWGVHATLFAPSAELDDTALDATRAETIDAALWSTEEQLVLQLCDQLHAHSTIDDAMFGQLRGVFEPAQIIELIALAGLYHTISFIVNTAAIEAEPWAKAPDSGIRKAADPSSADDGAGVPTARTGSLEQRRSR